MEEELVSSFKEACMERHCGLQWAECYVIVLLFVCFFVVVFFFFWGGGGGLDCLSGQLGCCVLYKSLIDRKLSACGCMLKLRTDS